MIRRSPRRPGATGNALVFAAVLALGVESAAAQAVQKAEVRPSRIAAGTTTAVTVTAVIDDASLVPGSVNLQRLDANDRVVGTLGLLADNGADGDTKAGDKIFTIRTSLREMGPAPVRLRVSAALKERVSRVFSAILDLPVDGAVALDVALGNGQSAAPGKTLGQPLGVLVTNAEGEPMADVPIVFAVQAGGGSLAGRVTRSVKTNQQGRASTSLTLGAESGVDTQVVEASIDGFSGPVARFVASALVAGQPVDTRVVGIVEDQSGEPVSGATVQLRRMPDPSSQSDPAATPAAAESAAPSVVTGADGRFSIGGAPAGSFKLFVDASSARGGYWQSTEFEVTVVGGRTNDVGRPIQLTEFQALARGPGHLCVDGTTGGTLTMPRMPGFSLTVAPGSVTFPGGRTAGCLTVAPVNRSGGATMRDRAGTSRVMVTVSPVGAVFAPAAEVTMPNVANLPPSASTPVFSYDHRLTASRAVGTARVSDDGRVVRTEIEMAGPATAVNSVAPPTRLNEQCIVSVLNRNTRARADGSWVLPNIPANFGEIRARATCIVDGVTVSGESAPFLVNTNGTADVPPIVLGPTTPIPSKLTVTAPSTRLTALNETLQMTVTAAYAGRASKDVTAASTGTTYVVSNPALASVTAGGLVRALQSGTVLLQATQEGTSGFLSVRVELSGDTDGDGIPDDVEVRLGLNPNNPADAVEDADVDGLANIDEYRAGTDPKKADTDGDRLMDGDEVIRKTNPLLADSDGDGVGDGLEVDLGTDPLTASTADLLKALKGIALTPARFAITFNTIVGDASVPLTLTGTMVDGSKADLTSKQRGTTYSSSDLTICNFSGTDGRIYAGGPGTCTITASVAGMTATAEGTVYRFAPAPLSFIDIPGSSSADVSDNYVFVTGTAGLTVVDASDHEAPVVKTTLALTGSLNDVKLAGSRAYVAAGGAGLHVVDITDPAAPRLLGSVRPPGSATDVRANGPLAFVASGSGGLHVIDVSDVTALRIVGSLAFNDGSANGIDVTGNLVVVAVGATVRIVDVSNPVSPVLVSTVPISGVAEDVVVRGSFAFVAGAGGSLQVVDFTTPASAAVVGTTAVGLGGNLHDVAVSGRFVFGADSLFVNGVPIVDVTDPRNPLPRARLDFPARDDDGNGIAVDGSYIYLTTTRGRLYIGQYRMLDDFNGIAPVVTIASPIAGATFVAGESIPVIVAATDDIAVASVSLLVNGKPVSVDTTDPYRFAVTAPAGPANLSFGATALDLGANAAAAADVTVSIIPDPLTRVEGLVVTAEGTPVNGAQVSCLTQSAVTGADGRFAVTGVPTAQPLVACRAQVQVGGATLSGTSARLAPVRSGTTDVGQISLRAVPVITSISPAFISSARPPSTILVTGVNLSGATFSFLGDTVPSQITVSGSPQIGLSGTTATLTISVSSIADGGFVLVAVNSVGSSDTVAFGGNTLTASRLPPAGDADADGLTNEYELAIGTDPSQADTDADGIADGWEVRYGFNPRAAADAGDDADSDGVSNRQEFAAGTSPRSADVQGPAVAQVFPADGATGHPLNAGVVVRFTEALLAPVALATVSQALDNAWPAPRRLPVDLPAAALALQTHLRARSEGESAVEGTVRLSRGGTSIPGTVAVSADRMSVTFRPAGPMPASTEITLSAQGVRDAAANVTAAAFTSKFTTGQTSDSTAPTVLFTSPVNGATGVPLNAPVSVLFSERIDPASLTAETFRIVQSIVGGDVPGLIVPSVDGRLVTFVPSGPLAVRRGFTIVLGSQVRDLAGNNLGGRQFGFTTGFGADTTAPQFMGSSPVDGDTLVSRNATVALQFNEAINPIAIASGLQVTAGGVAVAGVHTFDDGNKRVVFQPEGGFAATTVYTVTYTAQLTDTVGNALSNPGSFSFTTGTGVDTTSPTVVATNPRSGDTDVPRNVVVRLVFNERVNPLTITAETFKLNLGYTGQSLPATVEVAPDRLSMAMRPAALLAPGTNHYVTGAFTDVQGRSNSVFLSFTTGLVGDTTPPVVEAMGPPADATGLPVNTQVTVRFSEPLDATSAMPGVIAMSPAVAGTLTMSSDLTRLTFVPTVALAPSTTYTVTVRDLRDRAGNVMAAVTRTFATRASTTPDTTPPTITSITPAHLAVDVPITTAITVKFSEPITAAAVDARTMALYAQREGVSMPLAAARVVSADGTEVVITPAAALPGKTVILLSIHSNGHIPLTDLSGNNIGFSNTTFTTAAAADTTAPFVTSVTPTDGSAGLGRNATVVLTFSEPIDPRSLVAESVALFEGGKFVGASVNRSEDNQSVMLTTTLPANELITVVATDQVTDLSGNPLRPFVSRFTTSTTDPSGPHVVTQRPANGANGIVASTPITLYLSEPVVASTVSGSMFVSANGVLVEGAVAVGGGGTVVRFTPAAPFAAGAFVQVFLEATTQDVNGNALSRFEGQFRIAPDLSDVALTVVRHSASFNMPRNAVIEVEFSEPLDPESVTATSVVLRRSSQSVPTPATVSLRDGRIVRIAPAAPLDASTTYFVLLTNGLRDLQGASMSASSFSLATGTATDSQVPVITSVSPPATARRVGANTLIKVAFNEPINPLSVSTATLQVWASAAGVPLPATFSFESSDRRVTATLLTALPDDTEVTIAIEGIEDLAGNRVAAQATTFTTTVGADTTVPIVTTTNVLSGQTGVAVNSVFTLVFSEAMDPESISPESIYLRDNVTGANLVSALTLGADGVSVVLAPSAPLAVGRSYSFVIGSSRIPLDLSGNQAQHLQFSFTTAFVADTSGPVVVATNPVGGPLTVPINVKMDVLFDEPVDPRTVGLVTVAAGGDQISLTRTLSDGNRRLTVTPPGLLAPGVAHVLSIGPVRDTSGNALAAPGTRQFTTGGTADLIRPLVLATNPMSGDQDVGRNVRLTATFSERVSAVSVTPATFVLRENQTGRQVRAVVALAADALSATVTPDAPLRADTAYSLNFSFEDLVGLLRHHGVSFTTAAGADTTAPFVRVVSPLAGATGVPVNGKLVFAFSEPVDATSRLAEVLTVSPSLPGALEFGPEASTLIFTPTASMASSTAYAVTLKGLRDKTGNTMTPFTSSFSTAAGSTADTTAPSLASVLPAQGATDVPVTSTITLTFTEPVTGWAVDARSMPVYVNPVGGSAHQISGSYAVNSTATQVVFTPTVPFPGNHLIRIYTNNNGYIKDLAGNSLSGGSTTFTTAATLDTTAPVVTSVTPTDGSTEVGRNATVVLTFSEPIASQTISGDTFALFHGATLLSTSVTRSQDNRSVMFNASLPAGATITVAATSSVADLSGNRLAFFTSQFTTSPLDTTAPRVLTQRPSSGASRVPTNTAITLYASERLNASTIAGSLYVSQNGVLVTGSTAVTGENTVITFTPDAPFAADALVHVFLEPSALDMAGNALSSYQGRFQTEVDPSTVAPTVVRTSPPQTSGLARNVVFEIEFSEPLDPATVTSAAVELRRSNNAVWPSTVALRSDGRVLRITPTGDLDASTSYFVRLNTPLKDLQGTATSGQTQFSFTTGTGRDDAPLTVDGVSPPDGASGVGVNADLRVLFNKPVNPLSVGASSIRVRIGSASGPELPASFAFEQTDRHITLTLMKPLADGTVMHVSVDGVEDLTGRRVTPHTWQFTTGTGSDTVAPEMLATNVASGQTEVPVNAVFTVLFSEPMDPRSLDADSLALYDAVAGKFLSHRVSLSADGRTATLAPTAPLAVARRHHLYVGYNRPVRDLAGNASSFSYVQFTTAFVADSTAPQIVATNPGPDAAGVPTNVRLEVLFDEPIDPASLAQITVATSAGPVNVTRTLTEANRRVTVTPFTLLAPATAYTMRIGGVRDTSGNAHASPATRAFTTAGGPDLTPPTVVSRNPSSGDQGIGRNVVLRVVFDERISPLSVTASSFVLRVNQTGRNQSAVVALSADGLTATLTPTTVLLPNTDYSASGSFSDVAGFLRSFSISFTTGAASDVTAPTVQAVTPSAGSTGVPVNARVVARFSEPLDVTSVRSTSFSLTPPAAGALALSSDDTTLTLTPASALSVSTVYSLTMRDLRDKTGNALTSTTSTFTTGSQSTLDTTAPSVTASTPANGATGVAVTTPITITFSEPVTAATVDSRSITVNARIGGSTHQVAGSYAMNASATQVVFTPTTLPGNSEVQIFIGSSNRITDLAGNLLPFSSRSFTTAATPDTTAPRVTSVTPAHGSTDVGRNASVVLTFSEPINAQTLDSTSVALFDGARWLSPSINRSADNQTVILTTTLPTNGLITVVATDRITDLSNNPLEYFVGQFSTAPEDNTAPRVVTQRPGSGATGVAPATAVTLYVSEPLNPATVPAAVHVAQDEVVMPVTVTLNTDGTVITLNPAAPFVPGGLIQVFLDDSAQDLAGNALSSFQGQFRIAPDDEAAAPTVVRFSPPQTSGLPRNSVFEIEFSEALDASTVTATTVTLRRQSTAGVVPATVSLRGAGRVVRVVSADTLAASTTYSVQLTSGLADLQGTAFAGQTLFSFTTGTASDAIAPTVVSVSPPDEATGVGVNAIVKVVFSEAINPLSVDSSRIQVRAAGASAAALPASFSFEATNTTVTVALLSAPPDATPMTLTISGVEDLAGNVMAAQTADFTTGVGADTVAPRVESTSVYSGQVVPVNAVFTVRFTEPIDPQSVTVDSVALTDHQVGAVPAVVTLGADGRTVTLAPKSALSVGRTHTLYMVYATRPTDLAGNVMSGDSVQFTTAADADTVSPRMVAANPAASSTGVPTNVRLQVLFDEPIAETSLLAVSLTAGGKPLPVTRQLSNGNRTLTITPGQLLAGQTSHSIVISGVRDSSGNLMAETVLDFTTRATIDLRSPTVTVSPGPNETDVALTATVQVVFSEPVSDVRALSDGLNLRVSNTGVVVPVTVVMSPDHTTATLTPSEALVADTRYTVSVIMEDRAGNTINTTVAFTTRK